MLQRNIVLKYFQVPSAVRTVARSDSPEANWNLPFLNHLNLETNPGCIYNKRCILQKCLLSVEKMLKEKLLSCLLSRFLTRMDRAAERYRNNSVDTFDVRDNLYC